MTDDKAALRSASRNWRSSTQRLASSLRPLLALLPENGEYEQELRKLIERHDADLLYALRFQTNSGVLLSRYNCDSERTGSPFMAAIALEIEAVRTSVRRSLIPCQGSLLSCAGVCPFICQIWAQFLASFSGSSPFDRRTYQKVSADDRRCS